MRKDFNKAKKRTICLALTAMIGVFLTSCAVKISVVESGKEYNVNETCKVLESYEQYNIQVPAEQMVEDLMGDGFQGLTFQSHTVERTEADTSEGGKYDVIDTVVVVAEGADPFKILPQTIEMSVTYKRDATTLKWTATSEECKKWKIDHKKLGGTCWKMSTADGDTYIRLRDTIEFFNTSAKQNGNNPGQAEFATTILGAMATVKDGEMKIERIHVSGGSVSATGTIILKLLVDQERETEVVLSDFEKIEKADLPFTEEEYKATAW